MQAAGDYPIELTLYPRQIAVIRVNRPHARNALNWSAQEQFADCVANIAGNPTIRVLIITGAGDRAFVSGGDLKELIQHPEREAGERLNRIMTAALGQLTSLPIPVIAAINGDALGGGCEILTACDLRIAVTEARFSFAHIRQGLTPGWGGGRRLVQLIGQSWALELLLTGRIFDSEEALRLGLIHRIVPDQENVFDAAVAWADELISLPREAMAAMKSLIYAAPTLPLPEWNQYAAAKFVDLWDTPDHQEALAAFKQKRSPRFNQE